MNPNKYQNITAMDIHGPWVDSGFDSSLIERCRKSWKIPIHQLSDEVIATFIRNNIALKYALEEGKRRVSNNLYDDSLSYEDELIDYIKSAQQAKAMESLTRRRES